MDHVWFVELKIGKVWNPVPRPHLTRAIARIHEWIMRDASPKNHYRVRKYVRVDP